jgi:hypothetical protein
VVAPVHLPWVKPFARRFAGDRKATITQAASARPFQWSLRMAMMLDAIRRVTIQARAEGRVSL